MYAMMAPLGTLVFLVTLWLLVVVGAAVLEESGARIAAALKGDQSCQATARAGRRRHSRPVARKTMLVAPRRRAAA